MRIGVVIPVYNERELLARSLDRVQATPTPTRPDGGACERVIYIIDDGSTDGAREIAQELGKREGVRTSLAEKNQGKGAALRRGFEMALGDGCDAVIVQDADMEYDPADHATALAPILDGRADAVIGTRFLGQTHRVLYYWHAVGNKLITRTSNTLSNLNLTDIECGTKAFTGDVLSRLQLREDRFGIEPEIVARLARMRLPVEGGPARRVRIYEVPVSYAGRTYEEGKKIGWRDALSALRCIVTYNLF